MKSFLAVFTLAVALVLAAPLRAPAEQPHYVYPNYAVGKLGAYFPTGELDDEDFDPGVSVEVALGHRFHRNLALEGGVGVFHSEAEETSPGVGKRESDLWVVPLAATLKGIIPVGTAQLYGGIGPGIYFVRLDADRTDFATGLTVSDDDGDIVVGGHLLAGFTVDIAPNVFFGVEGKYIFTDETDVAVFGVPLSSDLNGFIFTGNVGIRF